MSCDASMFCTVSSTSYSEPEPKQSWRRENLLIAKDESFGEIMIRLETENNKDDPPE